MHIIKELMFWIGFIWLGGLCVFFFYVPHSPCENGAASAFVVLTGEEGRIAEGLALFSEEPHAQLLISGVGKGVTLADLVHEDTTAKRIDLARAHQITLDDDATNTVQNVDEIETWVNAKSIDEITLVTSYYHMPRSISLLRWRLPNLRVVPHPTFPKNTLWYTQPRGWKMILVEYNKWLVSAAYHYTGHTLQ